MDGVNHLEHHLTNLKKKKKGQSHITRIYVMYMHSTIYQVYFYPGVRIAKRKHTFQKIVVPTEKKKKTTRLVTSNENLQGSTLNRMKIKDTKEYSLDLHR